MEQYISKSAVVAEIKTLRGKVDSHDDYADGWHDALTSVETVINFLDTKDGDLEGTEIIHESMSKALENYKVSSELFDVATEYIRNTLPRFDKKFPVKSNEISAAIFFGANWERQRMKDMLSFIYTLEVKEVDLDFQMFAKEMDAVFALPSSETENTEENHLNWEYAIAKHFFELGLKASNPLTWEDIKTLQDKSGEVYAEVAKGKDDFYSIYPTEQSFLEEVLKRFKAQKGGSVWDYKK